MPIAAMGLARDQDHRRTVQSLFSGKLPRTDRHHLGLRQRLDAILPDGRAAARRVDEGPSGRAPGGMALRDRQTGWQGSLEWPRAPKVHHATIAGETEISEPRTSTVNPFYIVLSQG